LQGSPLQALVKSHDNPTSRVPGRWCDDRSRGGPGGRWKTQRANAAEDHLVGDFILRRFQSGLQILHKNKPDHILWETVQDGTFISAESAVADIKDFGTPMGFFSITDSISASYGNPTIDKLEIAGNTATVSGKLTSAEGSVPYKLAFQAVSTTTLRFTVRTDGPSTPNINRITLGVASVVDEGIFGFGEQLTYFNQKGHILPIVVQEHGVGRADRSLLNLSTCLPARVEAIPISPKRRRRIS
jgi:sulfoquinovosidase